MLDKIKTKIRALITDFTTSDFETFIYQSGDKIFNMAEENIISITQVLKNGVILGSGTYSYSSSTGKITIISSLSYGDIIEVDYTFTKYSDTELEGYITASLVWISIFSSCSETDYELEDGEIYPTPNNKTNDLVVIISSILIKPNYSEYRLPNVTVRYPKTMTKEDKIERLIMRFNRGLGVNDVLKFD